MMPEGWWRTFGDRMVDDIENEVKTWPLERQKEFKVIDVKEKWGKLVIYVTIETNEIDRIIDYYEKLSTKTCIRCGRPAVWISKGWISPFCDECARKDERFDKHFIKIEED